MATPEETAIVLAIARINEQIAAREIRMLASVNSDELQTLVDELAELYQSRFEREEALKVAAASESPRLSECHWPLDRPR